MGKTFVKIGYISKGMDTYTEDYLHRKVRVAPKIYVSKKVASRYGEATAVYVEVENE